MNERSADWYSIKDMRESKKWLFIFVLITALVAKGGVFMRGLAIDDYQFVAGASFGNLIQFLNSGRYLNALAVWAIDNIGVNISDIYFSLGIATVVLQALLVVTILQFVGLHRLPSAPIVGAIMVSHPYTVEALTFRQGLPGYFLALILAVTVFRLLSASKSTWKSLLIAVIASIGMLASYQVLFNYFAVVAVFTFIIAELKIGEPESSSSTPVDLKRRALQLLGISVISALMYFAITRIVKDFLPKLLGLSQEITTPRAALLAFHEIPDRLHNAKLALAQMYWITEPVFPHSLKVVVVVLAAASLLATFTYIWFHRPVVLRIYKVSLTLTLLFAIAPLSLGIVLIMGDWWPASRVFAQASIVIGLLFLLGDSVLDIGKLTVIRRSIFAGRLLVLIGFIFINNQIFADQERLNQWDRNLANRILSRLEQHPKFRGIEVIYLSGGSYAYPSPLRTQQLDLNSSALFTDYAKVAALNEASGYNYKYPSLSQTEEGDKLCASTKPWPNVEAIIVIDHMAIVCMSNGKRGVDLVEASWHGDIQLVAALLDEHINVNFVGQTSSLTPLLAAVFQRHDDIANLLLDHGANPNIIDSDGNSALMHVVGLDNTSLAKTMIAKNADVNYVRPRDGFTALMTARQRNNQELIDLLKSVGARG